MKVLIEVIIISLLIMIGWRQSFSEHLRRVVSAEKAAEWGIRPPVATPTPAPKAAPSRGQPAAAPTTPRDVSWMWKRKSLDRVEE